MPYTNLVSLSYTDIPFFFSPQYFYWSLFCCFCPLNPEVQTVPPGFVWPYSHNTHHESTHALWICFCKSGGQMELQSWTRRTRELLKVDHCKYLSCEEGITSLPPHVPTNVPNKCLVHLWCFSFTYCSSVQYLLICKQELNQNIGCAS